MANMVIVEQIVVLKCFFIAYIMRFFKTQFYLFLAVLDLHCFVGFFPLQLWRVGTTLQLLHSFSLPWSLWLQSTDSRAPGLLQLRPWTRQLWLELLSTGSVAVTHRLMLIFPDKESSQCLLYQQVDSSPLSYQGSTIIGFLILTLAL